MKGEIKNVEVITVKCTTQEEAAAFNYVTYGNKSAAYRYGFNLVDMKPETVWEHASRLFKKPHVRARVEELEKELRDERLTTRLEHLGKLILIRDYNLPDSKLEGYAERDQNVSLKASDQISKMLGFYAPIKTEATDELKLDLSTAEKVKKALEEMKKGDDC